MTNILMQRLICLACAISMPVYAEDFAYHYRPESLDVPNVGGMSVGIIDQQNEKILGEKVYREIHSHLDVIQNPWL